MKVKFSNIVKTVLALVLCCGMLFSLAPAAKTSAAKMTNKKAQKILKKKIKNKFCKYAFVDIDKDKIDELIVLGFSGKFVDGDDKEKTLNVYKISGKKAKSILDYSVEGDFYHPSLSFNLYYYDKAGYITVNHEHEGYAYYYTYKLTNGKFETVAGFEDWISDNEQYYAIGANEDATENDYEKYMKNLRDNEVDVTLKSCSTKIANKYLKKMLKAQFNFYVKHDIYEKNTKTEYKDLDGNGIDELIVWTSKTKVDIYYAINPNGAEYFAAGAEYKVENGEFVYIGDDLRSDDEIAALAGYWYPDGKLDAMDYFYIDENGTMTEYTRTVGDPEATEGRKYQILFAGDEDNAFFAAPEEQGALQTYFTFSPKSENGKGDRLLFDGGAYFYQRME